MFEEKGVFHSRSGERKKEKVDHPEGPLWGQSPSAPSVRIVWFPEALSSERAGEVRS